MINNYGRNADGGGTGDGGSGADGRCWDRSTRREWLSRVGGLAAGRGSLDGRRGHRGSPGVGAAAAKRGGILRVATSGQAVNMDPGFAQLYSAPVYQNVYNKLLYVDDSGQFVPGLAKSWKQDGEKACSRPGGQRDLPQRRAVHRQGRGFTFTGCWTPRTSCRCACSSRRWRAWRRWDAPGALHPEPAVRTRCSRDAVAGPEIVNEKALATRIRSCFSMAPARNRFVEW